MSFNTSYIQADTLSTATSTTIAGHLLSNGLDDSLTLGGLSGVMTMTQLNSDVVVSGTVSANTLIPTLGVGYDMALTGNLDMSSYDVKQVKGLSDENNSYGTAGQVLKTDGAKVYWASDAQGDVSQWATYGASANVNLNGKNLTDSTRTNVFIPQCITSLDPTGLGETLIGNSVNDSTKRTRLQLTTNRNNSGWTDVSFDLVPSNKVHTGTFFYDVPRSLSIYSDGNIILTPNNGNVRIPYNNSTGAISFSNTSGAISFNSTINNGNIFNGNFGTAGQIVQSNGISAPPSWVNAPTASNWASFPATANIDLNGFRLTNSSLTDEKVVYATSSTADPFAAMMVTKNVSSATADDITFIGSQILAPIGFVSFTIVTKNPGAIKKTDKYGDLPGSATFVSFNASANILSNDAGNSTIITYDTSRKGIEFNNYGCIAFDSVCNPGATPPTPGSFGTSGQVLQSNGNTVAPSWVNAPTASNWASFPAGVNVDINNKDVTNINRKNKLLYVSSGSVGSAFEDGQVLTPFSTIQKALDYINTNYNGTFYYIQLQNGVYNESFTITKKCFIQGLGKSTYEDGVGCQITGTITVNIPTTGDMFNTCFNLSGVLLSGYINNISNGDTCLNLRDVYIYSSGSSIVHNPSGLSRLRIQDCYISSVNTSSTDPLLDIRSGSYLFMSNCQFNAKGLQSCLKFSASSTCDTIVNCKFECSNTSASVEPLVYIAGTTSATYTITYCGFLYSSTTSKSANALASGIYNNSATGNNQIVSLYNSFFLLGTDTTLNFAIQDANFGTARAMIVLYYMCGASLTNAFSIKGVQNTNKFQLNIVS